MKAIRLILFIIVIGLIVALVWAFRQNEVRSSAGPRAVFSSEMYHVSFSYPADWQPVMMSSSSTVERFEGESGYFEVSAAGANGALDLGTILAGQPGSVKKPYGSSPTVTNTIAGGQSASLVLPSADADPALDGQAVLVVAYSPPLLLDGTPYEYLVIRADQYHIRGFAETLKFLK